MAERQVSILVKIRDGFSSVLRKLGSMLITPFKGVGSVVGRLTKSLFSFRGAIAGIVLGTFVTELRQFSDGVVNVTTLVDESVASFDQLADTVLRTARVTGDSFESLNKSLFDAVSAGVDAGRSYEFLERAAKLAAAGATTTAAATKGLTSVLNGYGKGVDEVNRVADIFFSAQKAGITTIQELAETIGKVVPSAAAAKVSVEELFAAVATLTSVGIRTEVAVTSLNALIRGFVKPTQEAQEVARRFGIELNADAIAGGRLAEAVRDIYEAVGGDPTILNKLFGTTRSLNAILALTSNEQKKFNQTLDLTKASAGAVDEAFEKVQRRLGVSLDRAIASVKVALIEFGRIVEPVLIGAANRFRGFVDAVLDNRNRMRAAILSITAAVQSGFELVFEVFRQGDFLKAFGNTLRATTTLLVGTLQDALPLLVETFSAIARSVAASFIRVFIAETEAGFARALAGNSTFGALLREGLRISGVVSSEEIDRIKALGDELLKIEGRIEAAQNAIADPSSTLGIPGFLSRFDLSTDFEADLERFKSQRDELVREIENSHTIVSEFETVTDRLAEAGDKLIGNIGNRLVEAFEVLPAGLSEPVQRKFADLARLVVETIPESWRAAGIADRTAAETRKALADGIGSGAEAGAAEGVRRANAAIRNATGPQESFGVLSARFQGAVDEVRRAAGLLAQEREILLTRVNRGLLLPDEFIEADRANLAGLEEAQQRAGELFERFQASLEGLGERTQQGALAGVKADLLELQSIQYETAGDNSNVALLGAQIDRFIELGGQVEQTKAQIRQELADGIITTGEGVERDRQATAAAIEQITAIRERINDLLSNVPEDSPAGRALKELNKQFEQVAQRVERPAVVGDRGFLEGVKRSAEQGAQSLGTMEAMGGQALGGLVDGLTDLATTTESFGDAWKKVAAQFLQEIQRMIVRAAILKAITALLGSPASGANTGGFVGQDGVEGLNSGGFAGDRGNRRIGLGKFFGGVKRVVKHLAPPRKYNRGTTFVPGPNVDHDMVHALLTPGEAVIRKPAVNYYGRDILAAINNMTLPVSALREAARASNSFRGEVKRNFNSGGPVPRSAAFGTGVPGRGDFASLLVADEATSEQILSGGGGAALLRASADQASEMREILSLERS